jgi:hypothetical protein
MNGWDRAAVWFGLAAIGMGVWVLAIHVGLWVFSSLGVGVLTALGWATFALAVTAVVHVLWRALERAFWGGSEGPPEDGPSASV